MPAVSGGPDAQYTGKVCPAQQKCVKRPWVLVGLAFYTIHRSCTWGNPDVSAWMPPCHRVQNRKKEDLINNFTKQFFVKFADLMAIFYYSFDIDID
jgi:hypothetical protein